MRWLILSFACVFQAEHLSELYPNSPLSTIAAYGEDTQPVQFTTKGAQILDKGVPIFVKGVCYSPAPIGVNPTYSFPFGDYFTAEYRALWLRDLPAIKAMGANTVKVYGWNVNSDHSAFLDYCRELDLWVIIVFYLGTAKETPVGTPEQQQAVITSFASQVSRYAGHSAILAWSFGNELNGNWNLFLQAFSDSGNCNWNPADASQGQGGCFQSTETQGPCAEAIECVYKGFFSFLNHSATQAKAAMGGHSHLVITCFADIDVVLKRIEAFDQKYLPSLDAWGVQLYRGQNFGVGDHDFLGGFARVSSKPLLVTEYGVDSYNDTCGFSPETVCYNPVSSSGDAQHIQADWGNKLSNELLEHSSATGAGSVAGGCIMAWADELWKTAVNVRGCAGTPWPQEGFDAGRCEYKAHVDCPNRNISQNKLCGYPLAAPFDGYVNEGYWGVVSVQLSPVPGRVDVIRPKKLYAALRGLWLPAPSLAWVFLAGGVLLFSLSTFGGVFWYHRQFVARKGEKTRLMDSPSLSSGYDSTENKSAPTSPDLHGLP